MPIRASTFPSVQWYTISFFPSDVYCSWFSAVCATRVGESCGFLTSLSFPCQDLKKQTPQGPLPELLSEVQHRQIMGQLGNVIMAFLLRYFRVGEPEICNVRKRSGPCYLNLYAQSKTAGSHQGNKQAKEDLVRDWKRQKRKSTC